MTSTSFKSPEPFNPDSPNPSAAWSEYKTSFKIYALAAKLSTEAVDVQIAIFLHILGSAGRHIYDTLTIPDPPAITLDRVYSAFDDYYEPHKNTIASRYTFFTTKQGQHQPIDPFITDLKTKARHCDFGELTASLVCTQIVCGLRKEELRKDLLRERALTLELAITLCQADEAAAQHASTIATSATGTDPQAMAVDAIRHDRLKHKPSYQSYTGRSGDNPQFRRRNPIRQGYHTDNTRHAPAQRQPHSTNQRQYHQRQQACSNCGTSHTQQGQCPARNSQCYQCSRQGHWASHCRSRTVHEIATQPNYLQYRQDDDYQPSEIADAEIQQDYQEYHYKQDDHPSPYAYCNGLTLHCHDMTAPLAQAEEWFETIYFANFPVKMKLDTGSQVNIIHEGIYNKFPIKPKLHKPRYTIRTYSGHFVDTIGVIQVRCASFAAGADQCFYVTPHRTIPILGAKATVDLGLIRRHRQNSSPANRRQEKMICATQTRRQAKSGENYIPGPMPSLQTIDQMTPAAIVHMYRDVFDRIGKLPGKYKLHLKPNVTPSISAPRQIPFALQDQVAKELARLQALGIIVPVTEPTDWVHPMVVVRQENKPIPVRICLDPRKLNTALRLEPYPTPSAQEIFANLYSADIFTVLDAQSAFWQVELDEESSLLCTFATPFGRFRFVRLALGICTSSSIFQRIMHTIYPPAQFPTTHISTDDFLIATESKTHNRTLVTILERARQNGLTFSSTKMQLAVKKITYLGLSITPQGLAICPSKIQAIQAIPPPAERTALQRFLGMVNFVARFVPQHSTEAAPLRALLKKEASFVWDANANETFTQLKRLITTAPVLAFFNPKAQSTISVDSSKIGVGAVLMQENKPVEYASTSFTPTQQNYAPIERELLGVVYACERFHYYVVGTKFIVETDHRPLVSIIQKPLHLLSPRLQRLVLKLTRYNIQVVYVPGSRLYVADTLSRAPRQQEDIDTTYLEGPSVVVHAIQTALSEEDQARYRKATAQDTTSRTLLEYIRQGWPTTITKIPKEIKPLWGIQEEFHEIEGLIYRGERLYIPHNQRATVVKAIHSAHQGITACLAKARMDVYWPQMSTEITNHIKACEICQRRERAYVPFPLLPHPAPQRPWEVVATDLFQIGEKKLVILVDYFSKFVEVQELKLTNTEAVINFLNPQFARYGAPQKLISDNGPPYNSHTFQHFLRQWGVKHATSSPLHPQSNGMVERTIQTIKNMIIKGTQEGKETQQIIMEYRATPIGQLPSPAEMLMGRRIRTPLTTSTKTLRPHYPIKHMQETLRDRQTKMVQSQRITRQPEQINLEVGTKVYHYIAPRQWGKATIIARAQEPQSYKIRTESNQIYRRTRHQLRPDHVATQPKATRDDQFKVQQESWSEEPKSNNRQPYATTRRSEDQNGRLDDKSNPGRETHTGRSQQTQETNRTTINNSTLRSPPPLHPIPPADTSPNPGSNHCRPPCRKEPETTKTTERPRRNRVPPARYPDIERIKKR